MRDTITATIFFLLWLTMLIILGISMHVTPDLRGDGGYEPAGGFGHPLYQDY